MLVILAITTGVLLGCGVYLLLRRTAVKLLLGLIALGHGANLLILTAAGAGPDSEGWLRSIAPLVPAGDAVPPPGHTDPIPQALVLTAIVIGFAVTGFAAVLLARAWAAAGTADVDVFEPTPGRTEP